MRLDRILILTLFLSLSSESRIFESNHPICEALFPDTDNITDTLVQMIAQEKRAIKIAIFYLSEPRIISALLDARQRNIDIQVIIDKGCITNLTLKRFHSMLSAGIQLYVYNSISLYKIKPLMHNKYCIFESQSTVWTGSFNFTFSAQRFNRENVIILENAEIVTKFKNNFEKVKQNTTLFQNYKKYKRWIKKQNAQYLFTVRWYQ